MSKYDPLYSHLKAQSKPQINLTFSDIEKIIRDTLPSSARKYNEWWANETRGESRHVQCHSWRDAGYDAYPDLKTRSVIFRKRPSSRQFALDDEAAKQAEQIMPRNWRDG